MALASRLSCITLVAAALVLPARSQELAQQSSSPMVEAARISRQQVSLSAKHPRVFTNDDFSKRPASVENSAFRLPTASNVNAQLTSTEELAASDSECYNSVGALSIAAQLQAAEDQRDQVQGSLSSQQPVISGNNLDMRNYQPGSSGIYVGSAPLQESQPQAPGRVDLAQLDEQIASLKQSLQLACDPPESAALQQQLDAISADLNRSQRQLALDQYSFYANPNYTRDTAGQAQLDAEQQYVDALVSEKAQLTEQLAASQTTDQPASPTPPLTANPQSIQPQP
jgi:hypothetical protein